jgi:hypothetical protein
VAVGPSHPDLFPDAVAVVPDLSVLDVLGRITDSFGASVNNFLATRPDRPGLDRALRCDLRCFCRQSPVTRGVERRKST